MYQGIPSSLVIPALITNIIVDDPRNSGWQESIITADSKGKVLEFSDFLAHVRKLSITREVARKEAAQEFRQLSDKPNTVSTVNFESYRSRACSLNVTLAVRITPTTPPTVPTIACKKPCECAKAVYTTRYPY